MVLSRLIYFLKIICQPRPNLVLSRLTYFHICLPGLSVVLSRLTYFHICLPSLNLVLSRLIYFLNLPA